MEEREESWAPDNETMSRIREEIITKFSEGSLCDPEDINKTLTPLQPEASFIDTCAKIGAFLLDKHAVIQQLESLNELILKKGEPFTVKKLRETLEEQLTNYGFHPTFGKTFENISPDVFRATIANGLLLKDAIIGGDDHGEFTHAIQWLLIAKQHAQTNFLGPNKNATIEAFKRLGSIDCVFSRTQISIGFPVEEKSIWDIIVDRSSSKKHSSENDFRSPEKLNTFIHQTNNQNISLLKQLVLKRRQKRLEQTDPDDWNKDLSRQYSNPHGFYHRGKLPGIHEPKTSNIDLDTFRQENKIKK